MNDQRLSPDDTRLTAYALGELGAEERAVVEAAIARQPELRVHVEATRALALELEDALAHEPDAGAEAETASDAAIGPGLVRAEKGVAGMPQYGSGGAKLLRFPQLYFVVAGLAAACVAVLVALRPHPVGMTNTTAVAHTQAVPPNATQAPAEVPEAESETPLPSEAAPTTGGLLADITASRHHERVAAEVDRALAAVEAAASTDGVTVASVPARAAPAPREFVAPAKAAIPAIAAPPSFSIAVAPPRPLSARTTNAISASISNAETSSASKRAEAKRSTPAIVPERPGTHAEPGLHADAPGGGTFVPVGQAPVSQFTLPAGSASYLAVREALLTGRLPSRDIVRAEEVMEFVLGNHATADSTASDPLHAAVESAVCPWAPAHRLVRITVSATGTPGSAPERVIAHDVSFTVDFDPRRASSYRLIGFEPASARAPKPPVVPVPFRAGHRVTALYEVVPVTTVVPGEAEGDRSPMLTVRVTYKEPDATASRSIAATLVDRGTAFANASGELRLAAAVAQFCMILRNSPERGTATLGDVITWAATGAETERRAELIELARRAQPLIRW